MIPSRVSIETVAPDRTRSFTQTFEGLDVHALVIALNRGDFNLAKAVVAPTRELHHEARVLDQALAKAEREDEEALPGCPCTSCRMKRDQALAKAKMNESLARQGMKLDEHPLRYNLTTDGQVIEKPVAAPRTPKQIREEIIAGDRAALHAKLEEEDLVRKFKAAREYMDNHAVAEACQKKKYVSGFMERYSRTDATKLFYGTPEYAEAWMRVERLKDVMCDCVNCRKDRESKPEDPTIP